MTVTITEPIPKVDATTEDIDQIIQHIRETRGQAEKIEHEYAQLNLAYVEKQIEIGECLKRLKEVAGHGGWMSAVKDTGYDVRTAGRLMMLPGSAIDQIRIIDTNLAVKLPHCLIKLESLSKLTLDHLRDAFADEGWYFEGISRKQIGANVKAICAGKSPIYTTNEDEAELHCDITQETASSPYRGRPQRSSIDRDSHDGDSGCSDEAEEESGNADVHEPYVEATFDSPMSAAIGEIAQVLYEQVTAAAHDQVLSSALHAQVAQGRAVSDMVNMVLRRLANKIAAQLSAI